MCWNFKLSLTETRVPLTTYINQRCIIYTHIHTTTAYSYMKNNSSKNPFIIVFEIKILHNTYCGCVCFISSSLVTKCIFNKTHGTDLHMFYQIPSERHPKNKDWCVCSMCCRLNTRWFIFLLSHALYLLWWFY